VFSKVLGRQKQPKQTKIIALKIIEKKLEEYFY